MQDQSSIIFGLSPKDDNPHTTLTVLVYDICLLLFHTGELVCLPHVASFCSGCIISLFFVLPIKMSYLGMLPLNLSSAAVALQVFLTDERIPDTNF